MPLFGKKDEAESRFKEAKRHSDPRKTEFDLERAISLLQEAVMLKPDRKQYQEELDETREIKAKCSLKFSMLAQNPRRVTFPDGEPGVVVDGMVEQGVIRDGDEVRIKGREETRRARVFEVQSAKGFGAPHERLTIALVTRDAIKDGEMIEGL